MPSPMQTRLRRVAIIAAAIVGLLALSIAAIWVLRPDLLVAGFGILGAIGAWFARMYAALKSYDPSKGPLALLGTIVTVVAALVPLLSALFKRVRRGPAPATAVATPADTSVPTIPRSETVTFLSPQDSIAAYLDQVEAFLNESAARDRFVALRAESRGVPASLPVLIQKFEQREATQARPVDLLQAHKQFEQYILLGPPGSGKSTCLKHLALQLIRAYRDDPAHEKIPIFASLANWTDKRLSALEFLRQTIHRMTGPSNRLAKELDDYMASGALVVLLDGLNEMPNRAPARQPASDGPRKSTNELAVGLATGGTLFGMRMDEREESVRDLARNRGVRSRFIIACRTHEFAGSFEWRRVHILPMDASEIDKFLRLYVPSDHERLAEMLRQNEALFELARNPFYLTLLTFVFERDLTTITTRGAFLELLLETLLKREADTGRKVDVDSFEKNLGKLAFRMIERDMIGSQVDLRSVGPLDEAVTALGINTGLLMRTSEGGVAFYHQLVQEFFAALALQRRFERSSLKRLTRNQAWTETLVLYTDIAKDRVALVRRLRRLLRQRNGLVLYPTRWPGLLIPLIALFVAFGFVIANLLVDWIGGGGWFLTAIRNAPLQALSLVVGVPFTLLFVIPSLGYHRGGIGNTAYVLGQIRSTEFRDEVISAIVNAFSRVGMARKKLVDVLVDIGEPSVEWLLTGLGSKNANVRRGCIEALGRLRVREALEPLIRIVEGGDPQCFIQAAQALGQLDDPRGHVAVAQSLDAIEWGLRISMGMATWSTAFAQTQKADAGLVARLAQRTGRDRPQLQRSLAITALGGLRNAAALPTLAAIGRDIPDPLRGLALKQLARLDSPEVVQTLVQIDVFSPDHGPSLAAGALRIVRSPSARDELIRLLDHELWWIRDAALESLGRQRDPAAVEPILAKLDELRPLSGREVAVALGRIGSSEAFDGLVTLAKDPRDFVREVALHGLDHRFAVRAGPLFLEFLKDPMYPDRQDILELLVAAPPPGDDFRKLLVTLQHDPDKRLGAGALAALERMNYGLEQRLKQIGVSLGVGRVRSTTRKLVEWTGWPEYKRLYREFELASDSEGAEAGVEAGARISELSQRDPEVGRRLRPLLRIFMLAVVAAFIFIGALPVLLWRPMSGLGGLAVAYWPWTVGLATTAGLTYVPGFKWLGRVKVLGATLRVSLVVLVLALVIRYAPTAIVVSVVWLRDGFVWSGTRLWEYKRWTGSLVALAILLTAFGRGPAFVRVMRGAFQLSAGLAVFVLIARLAILHWMITLGLVFLVVLGTLVAARVAAQKRRRARTKELLEEPALAQALPQSSVEADSAIAGAEAGDTAEPQV